MRDVIEHLTEPMDMLKEVARILRPNGRFYLTTGNFGSIVSALRREKWFFLQVDHIHYFSLTALEKMLKSAGLKIVRMGNEYPYGRSLAELNRRKAPRLAFRIPEYLFNTKIAPTLYGLLGAKVAEPFAATMSLHCKKM
jgi:SAM-dependent methyltransferase